MLGPAASTWTLGPPRCAPRFPDALVFRGPCTWVSSASDQPANERQPRHSAVPAATAQGARVLTANRAGRSGGSEDAGELWHRAFLLTRSVEVTALRGPAPPAIPC